MVKRCQWGICDSDSRYKDRLKGGVHFIPFPKPKRNLEKCKRWIKACGRPHEQLNTGKIDGNYHMYVCSKHFPEGGPTDKYPDPLPADTLNLNKYTPARQPPKRRPATDPPKKRRRLLSDIDISNQENRICQEPNESGEVPTSDPASSRTDTSNELSSLDVLALAAENKLLQQQLAKQVLLNEDLRRDNASLMDRTKQKENNQQKNSRVFNVEAVRDSPIKDNFRYFTGFLFVQFMNIFKFLVPNKYKCPITFSKTISSIKDMRLEDQLLLTLVKLRLNLDFKHIANLFSISNQDAGALFRTWINYMYFRFGSVPIWPDREILQTKMPKI